MYSVRSWDLAYSPEDGDKNDSTAGILMHKLNDNYYVINDLQYGQYGDDLKKHLKQTARQDTTNIPILIETGTKGGAAKFLYNEYDEYLEGYRTSQSEPIGSKVDRATPFKDAINDGKIHIAIMNDNMRGALIEQLKSFPLGTHDDIIDAMAYAYNYLKDKKDNSSLYSTGTARTKRRNQR
jgi:predicted phage terminase large subunit-like protein